MQGDNMALLSEAQQYSCSLKDPGVCSTLDSCNKVLRAFVYVFVCVWFCDKGC